jgi:hypothetical protein
MDLQNLGVINGIVSIVTSIGDLAVLGAALAVAIVCTRRRVSLTAAWLLFGATGLAFISRVSTRLFYMGYHTATEVLGETGAFAAGLGLDALDFVALALFGAAFLLFRPARPAVIPPGEVARG